MMVRLRLRLSLGLGLSRLSPGREFEPDLPARESEGQCTPTRILPPTLYLTLTLP